VAAVDRARRRLRAHRAEERPGDDVAGEVDAGVHAGVGHERREGAQRGAVAMEDVTRVGREGERARGVAGWQRA
jgi:hypothetical protein